MKKYLPNISALFLILLVVFATSWFAFPETVQAQAPSEEQCPDWFDFGCEIMNAVVVPLAESILQFMGFLTGLAGVILNAVVYFTVISMSDNYAANETAINNAWDAVRDLANMGFIFILLYAAIRTILGVGSDTKKLIVNVVIVAILINFSLFFTKLVIDAANILALFFHDLIVPSGTLTDLATALTSSGISNAFMQQLNLQSLYQFSAGTLSTGTILTVTMMGSMMLIIAAFVFFSMAIMLIVRYVVLLLVIILSPIAFIAFVLPALRGAADKWKETLVGQAFFAPIFFMIIWIAVTVLNGIGASLGSAGLATTELGALAAVGEANQQIVALSSGAFAMFMNFLIVIVFLLAALSIAKSWANKAGSNVSNATKWLTGAAVGGVAFAGRQTVGRAGQAVADSRWLKDHPDSRAARLALAAGRKTGGASFDARQAPLGAGKILDADKSVLKGPKGGYQGSREAIIKKRMAFEEGLKQEVTGKEVEEAMERRGWSKAENKRLGRTAGQVEQMRLQEQKALDRSADATTRIRQNRYRHSLSQTRFANLNLYSDVSTDAEAARRLRKGLKAKSEKDKLFDDLNAYLQSNSPTTPPPAAPAGGTTP